MIRAADRADAPAMAGIYNHYVAHSTISFEEQPVAAAEMARRMGEVEALALPWLVAESAGTVIGYAYASPWKTRSAYRFAVEVSVYVHQDASGQGVGSQLYEVLFARLKEAGMHAVIGGIALPNAASMALHEKFGMQKIAHFEQVGFKFGRWIDVGYWQKLL